jgi:hypothetical protein
MQRRFWVVLILENVISKFRLSANKKKESLISLHTCIAAIQSNIERFIGYDVDFVSVHPITRWALLWNYTYKGTTFNTIQHIFIYMIPRRVKRAIQILNNPPHYDTWSSHLLTNKKQTLCAWKHTFSLSRFLNYHRVSCHDEAAQNRCGGLEKRMHYAEYPKYVYCRVLH